MKTKTFIAADRIATAREIPKLRPGMIIRLADGVTAEVLRVSECRAVILPHRTREVTMGNGRTFTARCSAVESISPNSECEIVRA